MAPKTLPVAAAAALLAFAPGALVNGFVPSAITSSRSPTLLSAQISDEDESSRATAVSRQHFLASTSAALLAGTVAAFPAPSSALVKGNAPPPKKGAADAPKCRNVEECQEAAERAEERRAREEAERAEMGPKPQVAPGGTKYLDVELPPESSPSQSEEGAPAVRVATAGDDVEIHYKVLKLGKRSYDGLSGEGTVVFSRGYALEDDEKIPGDKSFGFTIGNVGVIKALNDAVPGMATGGVRRISVTPQNGWEKNTKACDGGPGGSGAGGELKTDYVVVPTATMVEQEACFDKTKLPFPATYAQERRMAQRFDQSLIMEVRLVKIS